MNFKGATSNTVQFSIDISVEGGATELRELLIARLCVRFGRYLDEMHLFFELAHMDSCESARCQRFDSELEFYSRLRHWVEVDLCLEYYLLYLMFICSSACISINHYAYATEVIIMLLPKTTGVHDASVSIQQTPY